MSYAAGVKGNHTVFLDIDGVFLDLNWLRYDTSPEVREKLNPIIEKYLDDHEEDDDYTGDIYPLYLRDWVAVTQFGDQALKNISHLIQLLDKKVDIVISSSWREGRTVRELKRLFPPIFSKYIVGKTDDPIKPPGKALHRAAEIKNYIKNHPEVLNYVVIDDCDNDGVLKEEFDDKFIHVDYRVLFSFENAKRAFEVLTAENKPEKSDGKKPEVAQPTQFADFTAVKATLTADSFLATSSLFQDGFTLQSSFTAAGFVTE